MKLGKQKNKNKNARMTNQDLSRVKNETGWKATLTRFCNVWVCVFFGLASPCSACSGRAWEIGGCNVLPSIKKGGGGPYLPLSWDLLTAVCGRQSRLWPASCRVLLLLYLTISCWGFCSSCNKKKRLCSDFTLTVTSVKKRMGSWNVVNSCISGYH